MSTPDDPAALQPDEIAPNSNLRNACRGGKFADAHEPACGEPLEQACLAFMGVAAGGHE
jgi:hypothetical protein